MENTVTHKSNLLTLQVEENETAIIIKWIGKSADRTPGIFINPILNDAFEKTSNNNKELIMNFTDLEFLNSSTVAPIVKILDRAKRGSNRLTIEYSRSLNWQELSFSALIVFQTKDKRIQIKGI
ncbi:MAG: hypothetical protein A2W19_02170 [Spirochaetes bacterium RBG_16_49_21]|nr:MAG: hypothetical protein A2W19_02170 [Spirochaetes bacterium RBG_16_49_21]